MDFEIRHDSAAILKPVLNAAKRSLKTAEVQVGPDGFKIKGTSPDNTTYLDIEIPGSAFDVYDVSEPGTALVNVSWLGDAIRGTRKTDPVALYTRPNADIKESARHYHFGTDEKRVLRDKDLNDVDALRSARPADLVGQVDYKSSNETKTAEITEEDAEAILYEINGSHLVIESDWKDDDEDDEQDADDDDDEEEEETTPDLFAQEARGDPDVGDYPTTRMVTDPVSAPPQDTTVDVTVNGRDFSKAFRGVESAVGDSQVFIGATEGEFILHGEGETDTVYATPEADVAGSNAAGLYSADKVDTLRMSLDRKASTELTISLPDAYDRSDDEDDTPHLLWSEFDIAKNGEAANVRMAISPRIRGANSDEDVESDAEQLARIAPSNYSPTADVRVDANTTGGMAKGWLSLMAARVHECKLHMDASGWSATFVDPANVMMQVADIGAEAFDSYTHHRNAGRLYDQNGVIGLHLARILNYVKLATKTEDVTFQVDDQAQFAVSTENFTAVVPTINPDSVRQEPDIPGLELPADVTVGAESFADTIEDGGDLADSLAVVVYEGEVYVYADGDVEDAWMAVDTVDGEGYASSLYSEDYLNDYLGALPSDVETLDIRTGREFPMFLDHTAGHPDAQFRILVAPRVLGDDSEYNIAAHGAMQEQNMDPLRIKDATPIWSPDDPDHGGLDPRDDVGDDPEEAAEKATSDDERDDSNDAGIYDPTVDVSEYGPTSETPVPTPDQFAGLGDTPVAPSDLAQRGLDGEDYTTLDDDQFIANVDKENPKEREQFKKAAEAFYDPSDDVSGDTDPFKVDVHNKTGVPETIGDWDLKTQVQEGRPVYRNAEGQTLRINRSYGTDVVHRRYYVVLKEAEKNDANVHPTEQIASDLSPSEAMDALEAAALARSDDGEQAGDDEQVAVPAGAPPEEQLVSRDEMTGHHTYVVMVQKPDEWAVELVDRDVDSNMDVVDRETLATGDDPEEMKERWEQEVDKRDELGRGLPEDLDPDAYEGDQFKNKAMENAYYWAAQLADYMTSDENAGIDGTYYVTIEAGSPILVMDESWNEGKVDAIKNGLRNWGLPSPLQVKELDDETRLFVNEPTGERLSAGPMDWRDFEPQSDFADTEKDLRRDDDGNIYDANDVDGRDDVPEGVNGWVRQDDPSPVRGLAVWANPNTDAPEDFLAVGKASDDAYLVQRNIGERGDYDLTNITTESDMTDAAEAAVDYMATHSVRDDGVDIYDPTDEFADDEMEEAGGISGIGEGRRKKLDAIDKKGTLDDPQSFDSLEEMKNAVREISLAQRDGRTYMSPPDRALSAIQSTWDALPEDARQAFLNDHRLYVKIRSARNSFNDWMGKKKREQEIPSTMEAGPSNYPSKKANKTAQYARDGREELDEAIDKIRSAANGAKQRALNEIGTSVGEQNEKEREQKREQGREEFEKGDLAFYSTTSYGNALWGVERVNQKSVTLRRPHQSAGNKIPMSDGETYPEYDSTRGDFDSSRLEGPIPAEEIAAFDAEDTDARMSDDAVAVRADSVEEAREIIFGEEWLRQNPEVGRDMSGTPAEDQPWLDELDGIGPATYDDLAALGLSNIADAKEAYQDRANSDTWQKALNATTASGTESLIEAVGADPDATVAEDMADAQDDAPDYEPGDIVRAPMGEGGSAEWYEVVRTEPGKVWVKEPGKEDLGEQGPSYIKPEKVTPANDADRDIETDWSVGDFMDLTWSADNMQDSESGIMGDVTRVDGDEVIVSVGDSRTVVDLADERVSVPETNTEGDLLAAVHQPKMRADQAEDTTIEVDGETKVINEARDVEEDTLSDAIQARGVNRITSNHLADSHDSLDDVRDSIRTADELTDLKGVGDGSAGQIREAFDVAPDPVEDDDSDEYDQTPEEAAELPEVTVEGDDSEKYPGDSRKDWFPDLAESTETAGTWQLESVDGMVGDATFSPISGGGEITVEKTVGNRYDVMDNDGAVLANDLDPAEAFEAASFHMTQAVREGVGVDTDDDGGAADRAARTKGELKDMGINGMTAMHLVDDGDTVEDIRQMVQEASENGDITDLPGITESSEAEVREAFDMAADDGDDERDMDAIQEKARQDREAVKAAAENDSDELPYPALQALKKNWSVYKRGMGEGLEAAEEVEEYREQLPDAKEAAAIINDIRDAHGQEPIDFDGVEGIPEVEELGGPITKDDPGVSLSFDWSPYDPTEDV